MLGKYLRRLFTSLAIGVSVEYVLSEVSGRQTSGKPILTCSHKLLNVGLSCFLRMRCLSIKKYNISTAWTMRLKVGR